MRDFKSLCSPLLLQVWSYECGRLVVIIAAAAATVLFPKAQFLHQGMAAARFCYQTYGVTSCQSMDASAHLTEYKNFEISSNLDRLFKNFCQ